MRVPKLPNSGVLAIGYSSSRQVWDLTYAQKLAIMGYIPYSVTAVAASSADLFQVRRTSLQSC